MAYYNEILAPRFARGIQKLMGIKGDPPVRQISGDIQMVIPIHHGVENRIGDGWTRWSQSTFQPGSVGNSSNAKIRNPLGTNIVGVLEKVVITLSADQGIPTVAFAGVTQGGTPNYVVVDGTPSYASLDSRNVSALPVLVVSHGTAVSVIANYWAGLFSGATAVVGGTYDLVLTENSEIVLTPGMALEVTTGNANVALNISWVWRERVLEPSEAS